MKTRARHDERDVRVIDGTSAVLGDLLLAGRVDDARVRLNEDVGARAAARGSPEVGSP